MFSILGLHSATTALNIGNIFSHPDHSQCYDDKLCSHRYHYTYFLIRTVGQLPSIPLAHAGNRNFLFLLTETIQPTLLASVITNVSCGLTKFIHEYYKFRVFRVHADDFVCGLSMHLFKT
jgi:hypothetical protein